MSKVVLDIGRPLSEGMKENSGQNPDKVFEVKRAIAQPIWHILRINDSRRRG